MIRCHPVLVAGLMMALPAMVQAQGVDVEELPGVLDSLSVHADVPGLGFAAFDRTGTLFEYVRGTKNRDTGQVVDPNTVFEAASISKPVFAYIVLSLVEEGVLGLDAPLASLVDPVPEVAYDRRAQLLTSRLILSHQGGLPNWRGRLNLSARSHGELFPAGDTLRFRSDPGERYLYSGEGYVLLQQVVETLTGQDLPTLARERVFGPLGMRNSSFVFDPEGNPNYAHGHNQEGSADKWQLQVPLASSTLLTTASDLAKFGTHLANILETNGPFGALMEPAVALESDGILAHSWGLGLGLVSDGAHRYFYHGGNNVIFIADFVYGAEEGFGYVLLTNSSNGSQVVGALEQLVFGRDLKR